jgi:hypothetical protein
VSLRQFAAVVAFLGVAFLGVAYATYHDYSGRGIEGAYFTRDAGTPSSAGIYVEEKSPFHPHDPSLWLGAGLACLLVSGGTLVAARRTT